MSTGTQRVRWRWVAGALLLAALPLFWRGAPASDQAPPSRSPASPARVVPGEIVVDLRDSLSAAEVTAFARSHAATYSGPPIDRNSGRIFALRVPVSAARVALAALRADPRVEAAELQRLFSVPRFLGAVPAGPASGPPSEPSRGWRPNDPRFGEQWNFHRIGMEEAWTRTQGAGVVVAVIDTGVALGYGDGPRCRDFADTEYVEPYDFIARRPSAHDDFGHGTHVAGTIAESTNNGEGVAGIAFRARLMPLKVLNANGYGRMSDVAAAIRYAADRGAHVINLSLGSSMPDLITRRACQYAFEKGVTIVAAAGNDGQEGIAYPAAYPECIAVTALDPEGRLAWYSSWGPETAISAPGGDTRQSERRGILQNTLARPRGSAASVQGGGAPVDDYFFFQGTSMATPHVAGVAALIVSTGVRDPEEVRRILTQTATPRGDRSRYGAGELNAAAAVGLGAATAGQARGHLVLLGVLWAAVLVAGMALPRRARRAALSTAMALSVGMMLPTLVGAFAGGALLWNMLGHSVLVPWLLLGWEADSAEERRFYALMALGIALHLASDLLMGTAPFYGWVHWAALPWLGTNLLVAVALTARGLRR
ncbi:MAG TPA: S8 family peptidase [Chthonomonadales bacterium]|nr:S8 family peptidase [Chthonomonadales bacterium]